MVFQKGNKLAKGSENNGRPMEYDREEFAKDLLEWVEDEDHFRIKTWRIKHKISRQRVMEMCKDSDVFRDAYAYALDVIADRREMMHYLGDMKDNLYNKHLHAYDRDIDEQRKDEKRFEIEVRYALADKDKDKNAADIHTLAAYISGINSEISQINKLK